jgi:hypothetical protein
MANSLCVAKYISRSRLSTLGWIAGVSKGTFADEKRLFGREQPQNFPVIAWIWPTLFNLLERKPSVHD